MIQQPKGRTNNSPSRKIDNRGHHDPFRLVLFNTLLGPVTGGYFQYPSPTLGYYGEYFGFSEDPPGFGMTKMNYSPIFQNPATCQ